MIKSTVNKVKVRGIVPLNSQKGTEGLTAVPISLFHHPSKSVNQKFLIPKMISILSYPYQQINRAS